VPKINPTLSPISNLFKISVEYLKGFGLLKWSFLNVRLKLTNTLKIKTDINFDKIEYIFCTVLQYFQFEIINGYWGKNLIVIEKDRIYSSGNFC
jgi:hypothetical protein